MATAGVVTVPSADQDGPFPQGSVEPARKWYSVKGERPVTVSECAVTGVASYAVEP